MTAKHITQQLTEAVMTRLRGLAGSRARTCSLAWGDKGSLLPRRQRTGILGLSRAAFRPGAMGPSGLK